MFVFSRIPAREELVSPPEVSPTPMNYHFQEGLLPNLAKKSDSQRQRGSGVRSQERLVELFIAIPRSESALP